MKFDKRVEIKNVTKQNINKVTNKANFKPNTNVNKLNTRPSPKSNQTTQTNKRTNQKIIQKIADNESNKKESKIRSYFLSIKSKILPSKEEKINQELPYSNKSQAKKIIQKIFKNFSLGFNFYLLIRNFFFLFIKHFIYLYQTNFKSLEFKIVSLIGLMQSTILVYVLFCFYTQNKNHRRFYLYSAAIQFFMFITVGSVQYLNNMSFWDHKDRLHWPFYQIDIFIFVLEIISLIIVTCYLSIFVFNIEILKNFFEK